MKIKVMVKTKETLMEMMAITKIEIIQATTEEAQVVKKLIV
jgi:hypothetical protein